MTKRVKVYLPPNWSATDNPGGPATFGRVGDDDSRVLQVSLYAEYAGGKIPNPAAETLIDLARAHGLRHAAGELEATFSGPCNLGTFGSAVFRSAAFPRFQLWYLTDGRDFVLATYICVAEPEPTEVEEARRIVVTLGLSG